MTEDMAKEKKLTQTSGLRLFLAGTALIISSDRIVSNLVMNPIWSATLTVNALWLTVIAIAVMILISGLLMFDDRYILVTNIDYLFTIFVGVYMLSCFLYPPDIQEITILSIDIFMTTLAPIIIPFILIIDSSILSRQAHDLRYNRERDAWLEHRRSQESIPDENLGFTNNHKMAWRKDDRRKHTLIITIDSVTYELGSLNYRKYDETYIFVPKILPLFTMSTPQTITANNFDIAKSIISGMVFVMLTCATKEDIARFTKGETTNEITRIQ